MAGRFASSRRPYDEWQASSLTEEQVAAIHATQPGIRIPDQIWVNSRYEVWVTYGAAGGEEAGWPKMHWLSIKRRDKEPMRDWRDLQRIKNDLIGPENEAVELFPAESRLVDTSNQFHLWVLADPKVVFPFGYRNRLVIDEHDDGSKQRAFEEKPEDAVSVEEAEA
jgi:hypothetical protein